MTRAAQRGRQACRSLGRKKQIAEHDGVHSAPGKEVIVKSRPLPGNAARRVIGTTLAAFSLLLCLLPGLSEAERGELSTYITSIDDTTEISESLLADIDSRLAQDPTDLTLLSDRALVLAAMGRVDAALETAALAIELSPEEPEGYVATSALALYMEDYPRAIQYADIAIGLAPDSVDPYSVKILAAAAAGELEAALDASRSMAELAPNDANNYNTMATLEIQLGQYDDAYSHYTQALSLAPDSSGYLCNRGLLLMNLGQYDEALEDFDRAVSLDSTSANVYAIRSRYYAETPYRDLEMALQDLTRAIELEPENSLRYRQRAAVHYYRLGDFQATIEDMDRAVAVDPANPEVVHARGVFYMEHGDLDAAMRDFDRALELDPDYAHVLVNRASILYEAGFAGEALENLSRAVSIDSTYAHAYYFRGTIYEEQGELERARADYESCLQSTEDPMLQMYVQAALSRMSR